MYYNTDIANSWTALSASIQQFLSVTMGNYTVLFNNGVNCNLDPGAQLCLEHTASGQYLMFDSGLVTGVDGDVGRWAGNVGDGYIQGCIGAGTSVPVSSQAMHAQTNNPYGTDGDGVGIASISYLGGRWGPCVDSIDFSSGVTFWMFGDDGTGLGTDYFNMVLEIRPGVFSHWHMGIANSGLVELETGLGTNYGMYMGASGPFKTSAGYQMYKDPFQGVTMYGTTNCPQFFHYPEGNAAGQFDFSDKRDPDFGSPGAYATNFSGQPMGCSGKSAMGSWCAGSDPLSGRTLMSVMPQVLWNDVTSTGWAPGAGGGSNCKGVYLGNVPGVNRVSLTNYLAGETFTYLGDTYIVFPHVRRNVQADQATHPPIQSYPNWGGNTGVGGNSVFRSGQVLDGYVHTGVSGFAYKMN